MRNQLATTYLVGNTPLHDSDDSFIEMAMASTDRPRRIEATRVPSLLHSVTDYAHRLLLDRSIARRVCQLSTTVRVCPDE